MSFPPIIYSEIKHLFHAKLRNNLILFQLVLQIDTLLSRQNNVQQITPFLCYLKYTIGTISKLARGETDKPSGRNDPFLYAARDERNICRVAVMFRQEMQFALPLVFILRR